MSRRLLMSLLLALLCTTLPAQAEDEPATDASWLLELGRYRVGPAPVGPRLAIPPDLVSMAEDAGDTSIWDVDLNNESGTWLPFTTPYLDGMALSRESVSSVLRAALAQHEGLPEVQIEEADILSEDLALRGTPEGLRTAREAVAWVLAGLGPSLEARAVLTEETGEGTSRLRAMGSVRLWPGRWTRVYLDENEVPCVPAWDLEVAQEATVMDPTPARAREGSELYLRFHPGETLSIVEAWAGDVAHVELVKRDLSALRNAPEATGAGVLSYPRSLVRRAFTHLALPTGEASHREVRWGQAGRRLRLALDFDAPAPATAVWPRGQRGALALLRTGAVADALEFEARPKLTGAWSERIQAALYAASAGYEARGETFEFSVSSVDGGSVCFVEAPAAEMAGLRALIQVAERGMGTSQVRVRMLAIPEPVYRKMLLDGAAVLGRAVAPAVLQAFAEAGAVPGEEMASSVLDAAPLGFRVGRSEPGLIDFGAELAEGSAGLAPVSSARFAGLFGDVRIHRTGGGRTARVRGSHCWADGEAGTLEVSLRTPISLKGGVLAPATPTGGAETVAIPILGGGHADFDRDFDIPGAGADDVLVHAHVRGDEVIVLLVSVR